MKDRATLVRTVVGVVGVMIVLFAGIMMGRGMNLSANNEPLPKPEVSEGVRGEMGIDKNVNETTIDKYLGRTDAVYRDMRMFDDPGNYAAIGGDSYMSGIVEGFEVVPYPYVATVEGLPSEVGDGYKGNTLFSIDSEGGYLANYKESERILEDLFPKDKIIFLMCGGGGYAGMMKKLLVAYGWDENKIYNVGGYWYYEGSHRIDLKTKIDDIETYAFWKVKYHQIDFGSLHRF